MHLGEHLKRSSGLGPHLIVVIGERVDEWLEAGPLPQDSQLSHCPLACASPEMVRQRLQQRRQLTRRSCPLGTMAKPLHGLVQITPRGPFKDRHDGLDPAPLPR
jgi:hypothetical protein